MVATETVVHGGASKLRRSLPLTTTALESLAVNIDHFTDVPFNDLGLLLVSLLNRLIRSHKGIIKGRIGRAGYKG